MWTNAYSKQAGAQCEVHRGVDGCGAEVRVQCPPEAGEVTGCAVGCHPVGVGKAIEVEGKPALDESLDPWGIF